MRKSRRWTASWILLLGVELAGLVWLLGIDRTEWIIRLGIVDADKWIRVCWLLWAAISVLADLLFLSAWHRLRRREKAMPIKLTFAQDKLQNPESIRNELSRFISERPQLEQLLQQGLDQLENITRKKEKMSEILERNDISLLSEAANALGDAEQTICRKLILVLNRALLCDPEEENVRRKEEVYTEHARYMQAFLTENEDVLNRCEKLLGETVRYVEEKKAGLETMDLQIMTDVIRSLYNDGIKMETK